MVRHLGPVVRPLRRLMVRRPEVLLVTRFVLVLVKILGCLLLVTVFLNLVLPLPLVWLVRNRGGCRLSLAVLNVVKFRVRSCVKVLRRRVVRRRRRRLLFLLKFIGYCVMLCFSLLNTRRGLFRGYRQRLTRRSLDGYVTCSNEVSAATCLCMSREVTDSGAPSS